MVAGRVHIPASRHLCSSLKRWRVARLNLPGGSCTDLEMVIDFRVINTSK